ncbi:hypothetical protein [Flagellimonas oceanensis]|uniref:hypothetical protein n=1 Tax=Flagellimonas oceanensis TaxID=2499163 RepID=UPI000F8EBC2A|nr:hypothetical protein [Allomuricauda oceanensis]
MRSSEINLDGLGFSSSFREIILNSSKIKQTIGDEMLFQRENDLSKTNIIKVLLKIDQSVQQLSKPLRQMENRENFGDTVAESVIEQLGKLGNSRLVYNIANKLINLDEGEIILLRQKARKLNNPAFKTSDIQHLIDDYQISKSFFNRGMRLFLDEIKYKGNFDESKKSSSPDSSTHMEGNIEPRKTHSFEKKLWFKVGLLFLKGEIQKQLKYKSALQVAKELDLPEGRVYISGTWNGTSKNILVNPKYLESLLTYAQEHKIKPSEDFVNAAKKLNLL